MQQDHAESETAEAERNEHDQMESVAVGEMARVHYESTSLAVPGFEHRLLAYQVHIGLDAQAWNAFMGRWDEVEFAGQRTLSLAGG